MSNCPNCGATLPAPDHKGTIECSYCGSLIEVGAIEWRPNENIPEPVYIDLFLDNKSIEKCIAADFGHAADAVRYMIGGIDR